MMWRHARRTDSDGGFTIVELCLTIVIMGLVMGPLTMALTQALRQIPANGARSQRSTDTNQLAYAFSDDVAQTQSFHDYGTVFAPQPPPTPPTAGVYFDSTASPPVQIPVATVVTCPSSAGQADVYSFAWTDQGLGGTKSAQPTYTAVFSATQTANLFRMDVRRVDSVFGTDQTLFTGYCNTNDAPITTFDSWPSAREHYEIHMWLRLRDAYGDSVPDVHIDGTARAG